jgi:ribosomal protein S18 acetylase RimI-like enzyme
MTPAITIRGYRDSDYDQVCKLNAYGLTAAGVPPDVDAYAGDLDDITSNYLTGRAAMLIGDIDGRVIAMGALRRVNDTTCEITRMRVDPSAQGRGHGKLILAALEAKAAEFGYQDAVLLTGPDQHPAIDLYQAAGYTVTGVENHGYIPGVRLHKRLAAK